MGVWTSTTVKRHLKAHLRDRFRLIAMVPYVAIRVPLAANSSYSFLFTAPCILLRGYTHMSAPVSLERRFLSTCPSRICGGMLGRRRLPCLRTGGPVSRIPSAWGTALFRAFLECVECVVVTKSELL